MVAPSIADLLGRNESYSQTHTPSRIIGDPSKNANPNVPRTCIVTCGDPRIHPETFLKLQEGEAVVFRTIAGHPQAVLLEIVTLDAFLGGFDEIALIHHTNCGTTIYKDDQIRAILEHNVPSQKQELQSLTFGAVSTSIEENVREDVGWLRQQPLVRESLKAGIKGYVYDVHDGRVRSVE